MLIKGIKCDNHNINMTDLPESASSHKDVKVLVGLMESVLPEGTLP